jgi:nicotinic acid mononucleotide adenylyltransferase
MLRALASTIPAATVWTDELDRAPASPNNPSYWVDTLERAHAATIAQYLPDPALSAAASSHARHAGEPLPSLHFMLGVDQAIALHRWQQPRRILELARPVIVLRPPMSTPAHLATALREAAFWCQGEIDDLVSRVITAPLSDVSASSLRARLASPLTSSLPGLPGPVHQVLRRANPYLRST